MALRSLKLLVGFDTSAVSAALLSSRVRRARLRGFAREPLPQGALVPSAFQANLARPAEVRDALRSVLDSLGGQARRACLILPAGIARTLLLEVPTGTSAAEFARFRLGQGLPYPGAEAVVDVLPVGPGRCLAAAVRQRCVAEYETIASECGLSVERVELAPLSALGGLRRAPSESTLDVILGDAAVSLAASRHGRLRVFRSRLRDPGPGEATWLRDEIDRTLALAGDGAAPRIRVVGSNSTALLRALSFAGRPAEPGWGGARAQVPEAAAELSWLGAVL